MQFDKLLVFAILIFLPFDSTDYLQFKIAGFQIGAVDITILVALIVVIMKNLATQDHIRMAPELMMVMLLAFGISLVSLIWTWPSKLDLKISLNYLEYIGLFYIFSQISKEEAFIESLLRFLLLVVASLAVLTILKSLGVNLSGRERLETIPLWIFRIGVVGMEGQFAPFSLFLVAAIPLVWQKNLIRRNWVRSGLNLLFLTAAIVTGARGLYVSLIALVLARVYFGYFRRLPGKNKILAIAGLIIGIIILASMSMTFIELLEKIRPKTVAQRMRNYLLAVDFSTSEFASFLFGYGKSNYVDRTNVVVHNFLLDILVSKGALTLIINIIIYYIIFHNLMKIEGGSGSNSRDIKTSLFLGFFGMLIVGQFDAISTSIIFWTYLAIIYAFTLITKPIKKNYKLYGTP